MLDRELSAIGAAWGEGEDRSAHRPGDGSGGFERATAPSSSPQGPIRSRRLRLPGERSRNVSNGLEFLRAINLGEEVEIGQRVAVVGGGNTAIDVARALVRLGKTPTILYRRSREEMPAFEEEVIEAIEEGVEFRFLINPIRILEEKGIKRIDVPSDEAGGKG